jgi:hypothetical protein
VLGEGLEEPEEQAAEAPMPTTTMTWKSFWDAVEDAMTLGVPPAQSPRKSQERAE